MLFLNLKYKYKEERNAKGKYLLKHLSFSFTFGQC